IKDELNDKMVLSEQPRSQYSIVFEGTNFIRNNPNCMIPVKSRREVELLLLILREEVNVIMNEQARELYPDIWQWLNGLTYSDVFASLKWTYREEEEVLDLIERIPLPASLEKSFIQLYRDQPEAEPIDQRYVHKQNQECVLLSKPYQCGNMFYFNGFKRSAEFNIDHDSDHLEGIIIFEAARQAGIASTHLTGIPLSGAIVTLKTTVRYNKFVECNEPYIIRTIPVIKQKGGCSYGVYQVIQKGVSCATGYFTGMVYKSREMYDKFRNSKAIAKVANEKVVGM
ncbi:MAG: hypothetical protein K6U80_07885, partial [Firmicutes bacterium]|nr:hypothetical protein [Bacillota bacterium]